MNEHYVTSREWSERLKKAGVEQESEFYWFKDFDTDKHILITKEEKQWKVKSITETFSAFLSDELLRMLPERISHRRCLYITPTPEELRPDENNWYVFYEKATTFFDETNNPEFGAETLPNALAAMVEYLRKEKIL